MNDLRPLQRSLQKLGLYLGKIDGVPGPLLCDAMACAIAPRPAAFTGRALAPVLGALWDNPSRVFMLYAMINAETGFKLTAENLDYSAQRLREVWPARFGPGKADPNAYCGNPQALARLVYSGRNGNCLVDDGWTFRGRGWPQLTGRDNYRGMSGAAGVNLELMPDAMFQIEVCAKVTVAFFVERVPLLLADAGNVPAVRRSWNGGNTGLQTALDSYDKLHLLAGTPT